MPKKSLWRHFVHLAYLDDSDTKSKRGKWQVMAGVIIEDAAFTSLEVAMHNVREDLIPLIPKDKLDKFEEFHAAELYGGYGVFDGIAQEQRFEAIRGLLFCLEFGNLAVVYGGVDIDSLRKKLYASANPLDICFRICVKGIRSWIDGKLETDAMSAAAPLTDFSDQSKAMLGSIVFGWLRELVILVVDDFGDKQIKNSLLQSFRSLRRGPTTVSNPLHHFHDDMYFGDSRYSIGLQLADLCSYFITRHLDGDVQIEGFYNMIEPYITFSETHPIEEPATKEEEVADGQ